MAGGPPLRIAEGERDLPLPFEIVGDLPELIHALWRLGHEILVVEDDYLLQQIGDPVDGAVVGDLLPGPVVDLPAVLFIGLLQGTKESRVLQYAGETRSGTVVENIGGLTGLQPGLYDREQIIRRYRLALQSVFRVLFFEPVDLYFYCRSLQGGRLRGLGKGLDEKETNMEKTAARRAKKGRTG